MSASIFRIACVTYEMYGAAQSLVFLDLTNPAAAGPDWKLRLVSITRKVVHGWARAGNEMTYAAETFPLHYLIFLVFDGRT